MKSKVFIEKKTFVSGVSPDDFLLANSGLSDVEAGIILLIVALIVMCFCLIMMVKLLNSMLQGSVAIIIKKVINTNFKYPFGWVTGKWIWFQIHLVLITKNGFSSWGSVCATNL